MTGAGPEPAQHSLRSMPLLFFCFDVSSTVNLDPGSMPSGTVTSSKLANGRAVAAAVDVHADIV